MLNCSLERAVAWLSYSVNSNTHPLHLPYMNSGHKHIIWTSYDMFSFRNVNMERSPWQVQMYQGFADMLTANILSSPGL